MNKIGELDLIKKNYEASKKASEGQQNFNKTIGE